MKSWKLFKFGNLICREMRWLLLVALFVPKEAVGEVLHWLEIPLEQLIWAFLQLALLMKIVVKKETWNLTRIASLVVDKNLDFVLDILLKIFAFLLDEKLKSNSCTWHCQFIGNTYLKLYNFQPALLPSARQLKIKIHFNCIHFIAISALST